jgi:hypothetical protein
MSFDSTRYITLHVLISLERENEAECLCRSCYRGYIRITLLQFSWYFRGGSVFIKLNVKSVRFEYRTTEDIMTFLTWILIGDDIHICKYTKYLVSFVTSFRVEVSRLLYMKVKL